MSCSNSTLNDERFKANNERQCQVLLISVDPSLGGVSANTVADYLHFAVLSGNCICATDRGPNNKMPGGRVKLQEDLFSKTNTSQHNALPKIVVLTNHLQASNHSSLFLSESSLPLPHCQHSNIGVAAEIGLELRDTTSMIAINNPLKNDRVAIARSKNLQILQDATQQKQQLLSDESVYNFSSQPNMTDTTAVARAQEETCSYTLCLPHIELNRLSAQTEGLRILRMMESLDAAMLTHNDKREPSTFYAKENYDASDQKICQQNLVYTGGKVDTSQPTSVLKGVIPPISGSSCIVQQVPQIQNIQITHDVNNSNTKEGEEASPESYEKIITALLTTLIEGRSQAVIYAVACHNEAALHALQHHCYRRGYSIAGCVEITPSTVTPGGIVQESEKSKGKLMGSPRSATSTSRKESSMSSVLMDPISISSEPSLFILPPLSLYSLPAVVTSTHTHTSLGVDINAHNPATNDSRFNNHKEYQEVVHSGGCLHTSVPGLGLTSGFPSLSIINQPFTLSNETVLNLLKLMTNSPRMCRYFMPLIAVQHNLPINSVVIGVLSALVNGGVFKPSPKALAEVAENASVSAEDRNSNSNLPQTSGRKYKNQPPASSAAHISTPIYAKEHHTHQLNLLLLSQLQQRYNDIIALLYLSDDTSALIAHSTREYLLAVVSSCVKYFSQSFVDSVNVAKWNALLYGSGDVPPPTNVCAGLFSVDMQQDGIGCAASNARRQRFALLYQYLESLQRVRSVCSSRVALASQPVDDTGLQSGGKGKIGRTGSRVATNERIRSSSSSVLNDLGGGSSGRLSKGVSHNFSQSIEGRVSLTSDTAQIFVANAAQYLHVIASQQLSNTSTRTAPVLPSDKGVSVALGSGELPPSQLFDGIAALTGAVDVDGNSLVPALDCDSSLRFAILSLIAAEKYRLEALLQDVHTCMLHITSPQWLIVANFHKMHSGGSGEIPNLGGAGQPNLSTSTGSGGKQQKKTTSDTMSPAVSYTSPVQIASQLTNSLIAFSAAVCRHNRASLPNGADLTRESIATTNTEMEQKDILVASLLTSSLIELMELTPLTSTPVETAAMASSMADNNPPIQQSSKASKNQRDNAQTTTAAAKRMRSAVSKDCLMEETRSMFIRESPVGKGADCLSQAMYTPGVPQPSLAEYLRGLLTPSNTVVMGEKVTAGDERPLSRSEQQSIKDAAAVEAFIALFPLLVKGIIGQKCNTLGRLQEPYLLPFDLSPIQYYLYGLKNPSRKVALDAIMNTVGKLAGMCTPKLSRSVADALTDPLISHPSSIFKPKGDEIPMDFVFALPPTSPPHLLNKENLNISNGPGRHVAKVLRHSSMLIYRIELPSVTDGNTCVVGAIREATGGKHGRGVTNKGGVSLSSLPGSDDTFININSETGLSPYCAFISTYMSSALAAVMTDFLNSVGLKYGLSYTQCFIHSTPVDAAEGFDDSVMTRVSRGGCLPITLVPSLHCNSNIPMLGSSAITVVSRNTVRKCRLQPLCGMFLKGFLSPGMDTNTVMSIVKLVKGMDRAFLTAGRLDMISNTNATDNDDLNDVGKIFAVDVVDVERYNLLLLNRALARIRLSEINNARGDTVIPSIASNSPSISESARVRPSLLKPDRQIPSRPSFHKHRSNEHDTSPKGKAGRRNGEGTGGRNRPSSQSAYSTDGDDGDNGAVVQSDILSPASLQETKDRALLAQDLVLPRKGEAEMFSPLVFFQSRPDIERIVVMEKRALDKVVAQQSVENDHQKCIIDDGIKIQGHINTDNTIGMKTSLSKMMVRSLFTATFGSVPGLGSSPSSEIIQSLECNLTTSPDGWVPPDEQHRINVRRFKELINATDVNPNGSSLTIDGSCDTGTCTVGLQRPSAIPSNWKRLVARNLITMSSNRDVIAERENDGHIQHDDKTADKTGHVQLLTEAAARRGCVPSSIAAAGSEKIVSLINSTLTSSEQQFLIDQAALQELVKRTYPSLTPGFSTLCHSFAQDHEMGTYSLPPFGVSDKIESLSALFPNNTTIAVAGAVATEALAVRNSSSNNSMTTCDSEGTLTSSGNVAYTRNSCLGDTTGYVSVGVSVISDVCVSNPTSIAAPCRRTHPLVDSFTSNEKLRLVHWNYYANLGSHGNPIGPEPVPRIETTAFNRIPVDDASVGLCKSPRPKVLGEGYIVDSSTDAAGTTTIKISDPLNISRSSSELTDTHNVLLPVTTVSEDSPASCPIKMMSTTTASAPFTGMRSMVLPYDGSAVEVTTEDMSVIDMKEGPTSSFKTHTKYVKDDVVVCSHSSYSASKLPTDFLPQQQLDVSHHQTTIRFDVLNNSKHANDIKGPRSGIDDDTKAHTEWSSGGVSLHVASQVLPNSNEKPSPSGTTVLTITDHNARDMSIVDCNVVTEYEIKSTAPTSNELVDVVTSGGAGKRNTVINALPMASVVRFRSINSFTSYESEQCNHSFKSYFSDAELSANKDILATLFSQQVQLWKDADYCFYGGFDIPSVTDGTLTSLNEGPECTINESGGTKSTRPDSPGTFIGSEGTAIIVSPPGGGTIAHYQAASMPEYATVVFPMSYGISEECESKRVTDHYISLLPQALVDKISILSCVPTVTGGPSVGPIFLPVHKGALSLICQKENEIMEQCARIGFERMKELIPQSKRYGLTVPHSMSRSCLNHLTHRLVGYTYLITPLVVDQGVKTTGDVSYDIHHRNIHNVLSASGLFTQVTITRKLTSVMEVEVSREVCERSGTVTIYCASGSVHKLYPNGSTATLLSSECLWNEIYVSIGSKHSSINPTPLDTACHQLMSSHSEDLPELLEDSLNNTSIRFYVRSSSTNHSRERCIDYRVAEEISRMKDLPGNPESSVYYRAVAASLQRMPNGRPLSQVLFDGEKGKSIVQGGIPVSAGRKMSSFRIKNRSSSNPDSNMSNRTGIYNEIHAKQYHQIMANRAQKEMVNDGVLPIDSKDGEAELLHYLLQETRALMPDGSRRTAPPREFGPVPLGTLPPYWLLTSPSGKRMAKRGPWVFDLHSTIGNAHSQLGAVYRHSNSLFNLLSLHLSGDGHPLCASPFPTIVPSTDDMSAHEDQCDWDTDTYQYTMESIPPIKTVDTTDVQNMCHIRSRSDGVIVATYNNKDLVEGAYLRSTVQQPNMPIPVPAGSDKASEQGSIRVTVFTDGTTIISVLSSDVPQFSNNLCISIPTHLPALEGFVRFVESNSIPSPNHVSGRESMKSYQYEAPSDAQGKRDGEKDLVLPLLPHMVLGTVTGSMSSTTRSTGQGGNNVNAYSVTPNSAGVASVSTSIGFMVEHPRFPLVVLRKTENAEYPTPGRNTPLKHNRSTFHKDAKNERMKVDSQITDSELGMFNGEEFQNLNAPYDTFMCFGDGSLLSSQVMSVVTAQPQIQVVSNTNNNPCTLQTPNIVTFSKSRESSEAKGDTLLANSLIRQISFHRPSGTHVRILPTFDRCSFTKKNISFISPIIVIEPYSAALALSSPSRQLMIPAAVNRMKWNGNTAYGGLAQSGGNISGIKATACIATAAVLHEGCPVFKVLPTSGVVSLGEVLLRIIDRRNFVTTVTVALPSSVSPVFPQSTLSLPSHSISSSPIQFVRYSSDDLIAMLGGTDRTSAHVVPKKCINRKGSDSNSDEGSVIDHCNTGENKNDNRNLILNSSIESTLRVMTVPYVKLHGLISNSLVTFCNKHRDGPLETIESAPPTKGSQTGYWGAGTIDRVSMTSNGVTGVGKTDKGNCTRNVIELQSTQPILEPSDVGAVLDALCFDFVPFMFVVRKSPKSNNNSDNKFTTVSCLMKDSSPYLFTQILSPNDLVPHIQEHSRPPVVQDFSIYRSGRNPNYDDMFFDKIAGGSHLDTVLQHTMDSVLLGKTVTASKTNVAGEPNVSLVQFYQSTRYALKGDTVSDGVRGDDHTTRSRVTPASQMAVIADQPAVLHQNPFVISSWLPKSLLLPRKLISIAAAATKPHKTYATSVVTHQLLQFKPYTPIVRDAVVGLRLHDDCQRRSMLGYMQAVITATPIATKQDFCVDEGLHHKLSTFCRSIDPREIEEDKTGVSREKQASLAADECDMKDIALGEAVCSEASDESHPRNTFDCLVLGAQNSEENVCDKDSNNSSNNITTNEEDKGSNMNVLYPQSQEFRTTTHTTPRVRAPVYLNQPIPWRPCSDLIFCPLAPVIDFGEICIPLYWDMENVHKYKASVEAQQTTSDIFCYRYIRTVKLYNLINDTVTVNIRSPALKRDSRTEGGSIAGPVTVIGGNMCLGPQSTQQFSIQLDTGNKFLIMNLHEALNEIMVNEQSRKEAVEGAEGVAASENSRQGEKRILRYVFDVTETLRISVVGAIDPILLTVKCRIILNNSLKSSVRIRPDVKILPSL